MSLLQAVQVTMIGLCLGLAGALAASRLFGALLFGVSPNDALTLVAISVFPPLVPTVASYVPTRRAMNVDPVDALRTD